MSIRFFYSDKCNECRNLLSIIDREKIMNLFYLICVDSMSVEQIMNLKLKKVPAIIIQNEGEIPMINEGASNFLNFMSI